jgi:ATP-dependent helicase HrpA
MLSDVFGFRRRLQKIKQAKQANKQLHAQNLFQLTKDIELSIAAAQLRKQNLPVITYPGDLPIAQKSDLIKKTIMQNQVTILCGETGSGKTTQLPKICLDIGLGIRGKIGHTQPRRLAARAVSQRIAEELNTELGNEVGYKVRFSDKSNDKSYIKLMTDGILLAECNHDPFLNQYDTIIIDEAHERSLNIDFLLGYLRRLIKKRKDLKIIITSATIDPDRFAKHFNNAPVINVSGRTYPVEVRYRPYQTAEPEKSKDLQGGIIDAVNELSKIDRGDILVFLSGERDIRETADALAKETHNRALDNTEVLPLLARLSNAEQNRIFHPSNKRRIVLATNVAETSLTVPGIKYVIDSGVARISRYSWRSKIQRLPIEKISQASANQRKGRCGRVSEGVCIRLYEEDDFNQRHEFTEPEIKRTNLAAVILQMENLRLGHINDFPFVEPPEDRLINDGYKLLFELGAIDRSNKITKIGKHLAHFPIDPKLARMLLHAKNENALSEVLIIVSALATQDPRERPLDKQQAADEKHAVFTDKTSDFVFYINLWNGYHAEKKAVSGNQLRKWCKQNFISWMRMREWIDTYNQIKKMLSNLKLNQNVDMNTTAASYDQIHQSLLIGLLANIGFKNEDREFTGARNKKFKVFPGSALYKSPPKWIMATEIVETTRVYARTNARIDVRWVEEKAKHLLKYHYANPHWEKKRSQVVAHEQSTLYGLIINPDKKVNYGRIDPVEAKEIFIRCALIEGDFESKAGFYLHNRKLVEELETLEAKSRRRDIIVDDNVLYDFYESHLPDDICSGAQLDKWLRFHPDEAKVLFLSAEDLIRENATQVCDTLFPDHLDMNGSRFPIEYHFDPRNHCDGITLITPAAGINTINPQRCEWLIPGLLREKIIALIKSLPKQLRKNFVPAPNFAEACLQALTPSDTALCTAVSGHLKKITGVQIPYDAWSEKEISQHLRMNFRVVDHDGKVVQEGRDLQFIKECLSGSADSMLSVDAEAEPDTAYNKDDVGTDILDTLKETVELDLQGITIKAYPALIKDGSQVNLRALESRKAAEIETHKALRQLFIKALPEQIKHLKTSIPDIQNLCLKYTDFGRCEDLKLDIINKTIDDVFLYGSIHTENEFNSRLEKGKSELHEKAKQWSRLLTSILDEYRTIKKLMKKPSFSQLDTVADIQGQLNYLFPKNFITVIDQQWLQQYPRYLMGINKRLDKSKTNITRDRQLRVEFSRLWDEYIKRQESLLKQHIDSEQLNHYRWMLEEYRVSLFAQELKTAFPISEKRLKAYWNELSDT